MAMSDTDYRKCMRQMGVLRPIPEGGAFGASCYVSEEGMESHTLKPNLKLYTTKTPSAIMPPLYPARIGFILRDADGDLVMSWVDE